jgi:predicted N-acetyltransferase YhbS
MNFNFSAAGDTARRGIAAKKKKAPRLEGPALKFTNGFAARELALAELFETAFTASEGPKEGALIAGLVRDLLQTTPVDDIRVFCAETAGKPVGAGIFTRLRYAHDPHVVFLLSPLAVSPDHQRKGVGPALIAHALDTLRSEGVQIVMTYGDPDFYRRAGFRPVIEEHARAPLPLSFPHGWIGQSLTQPEMPTLQGSSNCVPALNRSDVW